MFGYLATATEESIEKILSIPDTEITYRSRVTKVVAMRSKYDIFNVLRSIEGVTEVRRERTDGTLFV
jgi:hypothetical protein